MARLSARENIRNFPTKYEKCLLRSKLEQELIFQVCNIAETRSTDRIEGQQ